jgi:hypothetical protein
MLACVYDSYRQSLEGGASKGGQVLGMQGVLQAVLVIE